MFINSLCNYYDILSKSSKIIPDGYSKVLIDYIVYLTPQGKIDDIVNCQKKIVTKTSNGKEKTTYLSKEIIMPKRTEKTGIDANFIEHRFRYLFGLNYDKNHFSSDDKTNKARKSHELLVKKNLNFIDGINSPVVNAYRAFLKTWQPERECENSYLLRIGKKLTTSNFAISLAGNTLMLHDDPELKRKWENIYTEHSKATDEDVFSQCAISGEYRSIAKIHNKIWGLNSTGTYLVSFGEPSFSSYGNIQSYNSNISNEAMKKYTKALNYLLASKNHRFAFEDITIVYWTTDSVKDETYSEMVSSFLFDDKRKISNTKTHTILEQLFNDIKTGSANTQEILLHGNIDKNAEFYMAGLKPNSGRLSQKFIYRKRFGELIQNIVKHKNDMYIGDSIENTSLYHIKNEIVVQAFKDKAADPNMVANLIDSIINGTKYPNAILSKIIARIRKDCFVNKVRVGIIKAYINRNIEAGSSEKKIKTSLDLESTNMAYLCGRLFATLEMIQQDATNTKLNRTIRESFFTSVLLSPCTMLPRLVARSQDDLKRLSNVRYKSEIFYTAILVQIKNSIGDQYPNTFSLVDQGKFIVGYYQQREAFFSSKNNPTSQIQNSEENK